VFLNIAKITNNSQDFVPQVLWAFFIRIPETATIPKTSFSAEPCFEGLIVSHFY
jgi:hypothetical protein